MGSIVALLFCFCNGEVQSELRKMWQRWRESNHRSLRSHHSILTQSLTYISRGRSSVLSLHSASVERRDTYVFGNIPPGSSSHACPGGKSEGGSLNTPALSVRASQSSLGNSTRLSFDDSCATCTTTTGATASRSMMELRGQQGNLTVANRLSSASDFASNGFDAEKARRSRSDGTSNHLSANRSGQCSMSQSQNQRECTL